MGRSFPNLPTLEEALTRADESQMRLAPRPSAPPTGRTEESVVARRGPPPRGTPTLQSLATAKIAEEETRLAKTVPEEKQSVDRATSPPSLAFDPPAEDDPFGGLIPVGDDADPFGGLIPVSEESGVRSFDDFGELRLDLDDPSEPVPSAPGIGEDLRQIPRLLVGPKELAKLPMDPRAAFLVGNVDGVQSIEEILDICPMPQAEALEMLERLCSMGVLRIGLSVPPRRSG